MSQGRIIRLVLDKAFGFIESPAGDVFFHRSTLADGLTFEELREGMVVTFEPTSSPKGLRARQVMVEGSEP